MDRMLVRTNYFKKNIDKLIEKDTELDKRVFTLEKHQEALNPINRSVSYFFCEFLNPNIFIFYI